MPTTKEFSYRLDILDACLRRRNKNWNIEALLDAVNEKLNADFKKAISRRTLFNDIKHLVEELNAPVEKKNENGKVYYRYGRSDYSIRNLPLASEDVGFLREAVTMLKQISSISVVDDIDAIITRLEHTVDASSEPEVPAILFEQHSLATGGNFIDDLLQAIRGRTTMAITYQSFQMEQPETWTIHPYLLKEYRGRWFLIGRKDESEKQTVLALDRIKKLKPSKSAFITNSLFDPTDLYHHLIGVTFPEDEKVQEIQIQILESQRNYVLTKPIHSTQEIVETDAAKGTLIISLQLINNYELRSHLLSYGPGIEVISPKDLRAQMQTIFKQGSEIYK